MGTPDRREGVKEQVRISIDPSHAEQARKGSQPECQQMRNPLYLGGTCLLAGIALGFSLLWSFVLLLPAIVACHYLLIAPEEKYLAAKFDGEYIQYAASVRRWFGHVRD